MCGALCATLCPVLASPQLPASSPLEHCVGGVLCPLQRWDDSLGTRGSKAGRLCGCVWGDWRAKKEAGGAVCSAAWKQAADTLTLETDLS